MRTSTRLIMPALLALACQPPAAVRPARQAQAAATGATTGAAALPAQPSPAAPSAQAPNPASLPDLLSPIPADGPVVATLHTSLGEVRCALAVEAAPRAAASFIALATGRRAWLDHASGALAAERPFYDQTVFHRALPDLFIQAGDRSGTGRHGPGWDLPVERGLPHDRAGLLILARAGARSSGSQFLLAATALPALTGEHTAFGVCSPVSLIQQMTRLPTDAQDRPLSPPILRAVTLSAGSAL
jgi:cyclophilin family peptidyl-prolyl cis-trans isomerase